MKYLLISDQHVPHHNRWLFDVTLKVAEDFQPDVIVLAGDLFDFAAASSYRKNPYLIDDIKKTADKGIKEIIAPLHGRSKKLIFFEGNHDERLHRYITDNAPAFASLIKASGGPWDMIGMTGMVPLVDLVVPYRTFHELEKGFRVTHGHFVRKNPGASVLAHAVSPGHLAIGHCHRLSQSHRTGIDGSIDVLLELGHQCVPEQTPGWHAGCQWQASAGTLVDTDSGFSVIQLPLISNKVKYNGKTFRVEKRRMVVVP